MKQGLAALRFIDVSDDAENTILQDSNPSVFKNYVYPVTNPICKIGRSSKCDIILSNPAISREHCMLELNDSHWFISNISGHNKLMVANDAVPPGDKVALEPGEVIIIGSDTFQFIAPKLDQPVTQLPEAYSLSRASDTSISKTGIKSASLSDSFEFHIFNPGLTMQYSLPKPKSSFIGWLLTGSILILAFISLFLTYDLNSSIASNLLAQQGVRSLLTDLALPLPPAIGITVLVTFGDRYEQEPLLLKQLTFLWGAAIAIPLAFFGEKAIDNLLTSWVSSTNETLSQILLTAGSRGITAAITEEIIKGAGLVVLLFLLKDEFDNVTDGIIYGALIGAGFSLVENFGYFASSTPQTLPYVFIGRTLLGWLNHSAFTACLGAGLGYMRENPSKRKALIYPILGLLAGIILHSIFDTVDFASAEIATSHTIVITAKKLLFIVLLNYLPPIIAQIMLVVLFLRSLGREASIIRQYLANEVIEKIISVDEYILLQESFNRKRTERLVLRQFGFKRWREICSLHQTSIGLAFHQWHISLGNTSHNMKGAYRNRIDKLRKDLQKVTLPAFI